MSFPNWVADNYSGWLSVDGTIPTDGFYNENYCLHAVSDLDEPPPADPGEKEPRRVFRPRDQGQTSRAEEKRKEHRARRNDRSSLLPV